VEPFYATLAGRLRRDILDGTLTPGSYLPSEKDLQGEQGVSRGTVRRALSELIAEGLIVSRNGRGHQVRRSMPLVWCASDPERHDGSATGPSDVWSRCVRVQGYEPSERITAEIGYADERIAGWLDVAPGEPVSIRRRRRHIGAMPYSIADSFYPRSIVAGTEIELPGDVHPGIYAVFARLGRAWVRTTDRWTPRAPTREEAVTLAIPRGVAVAEVARRSFDADGIPVRLSLFILPGDRHYIEYEHTEETA
jgi:DNA-binding GntR family transcriptional regulator